MLTDWFTVLVQGINFLILVGLLSKFLFTPVIRAMDKREADIADTLTRAREREHRAEEAETELARKHLAIAEEREAVLAGAREQAANLERELSVQAREKVDQARIQWEQDLRQARDRFLDKATAAVSEQVVRATEQVLRDLSGQDLEQAVLNRFLERLGSRNEVPDLSASNALVLRTTFSLEEHSRNRTRNTLQTLFPDADRIEFTDSMQGPAGIELAWGSHKITWGIEDHLQSVRNELNGLLNMEEQPS